MRVAYLTSLYPAPSHTFIRREVTALRARGVDVQTFSVRGADKSGSIDQRDREEAERTYALLKQGLLTYLRAHVKEAIRQPRRYARTLMSALRHRPPGFKAALLSIAHFGEAILLSSELQRRDIAHLHNHFGNSGATVGLLASQHAGLTWSFTIHGISEFDYPAGLLLPDKVMAASFVACVSYFGRAQASRIISSSNWNKLVIVRCGLELDQLPAAVTRQDGNLRFCLVGRLSAEKGIGGLLEALALVPASDRPELVIVGDGPMRAELDFQVARLGLTDQVMFTGRLSESETLAAISQSDALVLTSFMEGLPIVLMEAMALGKPVIATRVAGIPELVIEDKNGLLFTPSHWGELAEKLQLLAHDKDLRVRLGSAGLPTITAEFDIRKSAAQLHRLFRQAAPSVAKFSEHRIAPVSGTSGSSTADRVADEAVPRG
jgi:glycosyltransferase involved in cell wall biosynthesis